MKFTERLEKSDFKEEEKDSSILVFWAMSLVVLMGFLALILNFGRVATLAFYTPALKSLQALLQASQASPIFQVLPMF